MVPPLDLPPVEALEKLFFELYGKPVPLKSLPRGPVEPPWVVSVYRGGDDTARVACLCELVLACRAGAALSMMPVETAEESVASGHLSETLLENYREVMNVMATVLSGHGVRVVLREITGPPENAPPELLRKALTSKRRLDAEVSLPGYGAGRLMFAVL